MFVLAVQLKFNEIETRDEYLGLWKDLAAYVAKFEHKTLSFELSIADNDPLKVLVFERWGRGIGVCL